MTDATPHRRYVVFTLAVLTALAAAAILFNARVDPYRVEAAATGLAEGSSPRAGGFHRAAALARSARAKTAILGTSRAESGLPADHPAFAAEHKPVINLALGGASIEQIRLLLVHAHTSSPLARVVIGLDLESFLGDGRSDFDAGLLAGNQESQPAPLAWLRMQVSLATLLASARQRLGLDTGMQTLDPEPGRTGPDGRPPSQRVRVWASEFRNFYTRLPLLFPSADIDTAWDADEKRRAAMSSFAELLRYARAHNIDLRLFISPVHARYLDWYRRVGWWPLYEAWKQALAAAIDRESGDRAGGRAFVLWDMAGFRGPGAEMVPPLDDTTSRMHWYLESSHYSEKLGGRILDIVVNDGPAQDDWPVARITAETLDAHRRRLYRESDAWRSAHPRETANVVAMVSYVRHMARRR